MNGAIKMNQKAFGRKRSWPNLGTIPAFPGGTEENHKNLSEDGRCAGPESNWALPVYESKAWPLDLPVRLIFVVEWFNFDLLLKVLNLILVSEEQAQSPVKKKFISAAPNLFLSRLPWFAYTNLCPTLRAPCNVHAMFSFFKQFP
jgi:hypothetical protein